MLAGVAANAASLLSLSWWPTGWAGIALCFIVSGVASVGLGLLSFCVETNTFKGLKALERVGILERLSPEIPVTVDSFQLRTFLNFIFSSWPVLFLGLVFRETLIATAKPCYNPVKIAAFLWVAAVLHDHWFFFFHSILHKVKPLFRTIHYIHHKREGDLNVFNTAEMHLVEAFVLVFGFYGVLLSYYLVRGSWDPISYVIFVLVEASMNMEGHTGYRLPLWLFVLCTAGIGLTPYAASSTTHYIHHLDPRYNRALYLTWADRWAGTFKGTHPRIKNFSPEEQSEYDNRIFRKMGHALQELSARMRKITP